ncbi:DUF1294 domain-containing protein [Pseudolysobacter antarcticus]|uniref:DUF1294 domain-containing protein n=2 Tax=Pseudolysobacter antarcticus TaxID=2511995 RepID=A0A411HQD8_9GAMM|nr:DUF1294 domain-containing protein [Pseudolysobacter antarcticus]
MRYQGKIVRWNDPQGFGFIVQNGGTKEIFVHIKSFKRRQRRPVENEVVIYETKIDAKGRMQAENVTFVGESMASALPHRIGAMPLIFAVSFLIFVAGAAFIGKLPWQLLLLYLVASSSTFVAYVFDKSAAKRGQWRTPENTLHIFAMVGGWPGALAAQKLIHHKSRKPSFQQVFWVTVVFNCAALGFLFSRTGAEMLRTVLGMR